MVVRLVTFDALGTLFTFKTSVPKVYAKVAQKYHIHITPENIDKSFRVAFKNTSNKWPNFGSNAGISSFVWWSDVISNTFSSCGFDEMGTLQKMSKELIETFPNEYALFGDALPLLDSMMNVKKVIISNTDESIHRVLRNLNIEHYFDAVLSSKEVGTAKPAKEIFQEALRRTNVLGKSLSLHS